MGVDGAWADDQLLSDLGVGETLRQQAQHLHFAKTQVVRVSWRHGRRVFIPHSEGLFGGQRAASGPGCGEGGEIELVTGRSDSALIGSTFKGREVKLSSVA